MIRHGDRGPLRPIRNQGNIDCGTTHSPLLSKYLRTMKHLQGSIKHLSNFTKFPLHPDLKQCTIEQLTLLGAHQLLMVGQALKKSYIEDHKLLTNNWTSNDIEVYSTVYPRTFQSAVAFLFGFLPTFNISNINITPAYDHRFCMSLYYCSCPLVQTIAERVKKEKIDLLSDTETLNVIQQLISIVKNEPEQHFKQDSHSMFDALMGYVCHASPLPCISGSNKCAKFEHLYTILAHINWAEQKILEDSTKKKVAFMKLHGFLENLISKINNNINGKNPTKFVLYSAHDLSLLALLSVLDIDAGSMIPYASYIAFEVYSLSVNNERKYVLRIMYNGRDVTKQVSFCKSSEFTFNNSSHCTLDDLKKFVVSLISSIGFKSFQDACNS